MVKNAFSIKKIYEILPKCNKMIKKGYILKKIIKTIQGKYVMMISSTIGLLYNFGFLHN